MNGENEGRTARGYSAGEKLAERLREDTDREGFWLRFLMLYAHRARLPLGTAYRLATEEWRRKGRALGRAA